MICRPALDLAGMAALDQAGDDGADAERALHQARFGKPGIEVVAQHVLAEEVPRSSRSDALHLGEVGHAPDGQRVVAGDEPTGLAPSRSSRRVSSMPSV